MSRPPRDFYEIQESQRRKSFFLFAFVLLFHIFAVGLISLAFAWTFGLLLGRGILSSPVFWSRFAVFVIAAAGIIAALHFEDARRNGAAFILRRLQAGKPDPGDRYHLQFLNTLEEMRIAAGLPAARGYILPFLAVNSLAVIEKDGTPAVIVTEGLLASARRDELQAAVAHELAHIARGDAFYVTLVCSLANLFEKLRESLEPEPVETPASFQGDGAWLRDSASSGSGRSAGLPFLFYFAALFADLVMKLLSSLISRERELLADAAAAELSRSPEALARVLLKAHLTNSFIGDFSRTYSPLFMADPEASTRAGERSWRVFSTHPPHEKRLAALTPMVRKTTDGLLSEILADDRERERARVVLRACDETSERDGTRYRERQVPASAAAFARVWLIACGRDVWEGPLGIDELLAHRRFSPSALVRNVQEGVKARAREFPQVRVALQRLRKTPVPGTAGARRRQGQAGAGLRPGTGSNRCPRCDIPLEDCFYEGVSVRTCPKCRGRLVDMAAVDRIIARREFAFSDGLSEKARAFNAAARTNPLRRLRISEALSGARLDCPACGWKMVERPFNYEYFVPVDKCLACHSIWFDGDELEILQFVIEERTGRKRSA
jgi:Zn-dependent protease with chaperone function/Zn-finger nucleic acid-binding protein